MMLKEIVAAVSVVVSLVAVHVFIAMQNQRAVASVAQGAVVYTLSGVADNGVWTLEEVNGINYWWKTFEPVTLRVEEGQDVVLRLQSTDVHHRFYAPSLGIGPIDVEPGHTEIVRFKAKASGEFKYYCTSLCGDCHFSMSGWIVVSPKEHTPKADEGELLVDQCLTHELLEPSGDDMIQRGEYLYQKNSCTSCHGKDGKGGVRNLNATKETVPAHNALAEKFFLEDEESVEAFVELLSKRVNLDEIDYHDDIPRFILVLTQYKAARALIIKGQAVAKLDKTGLEPPLQMPSWREVLSDRDVDSIIAYLLTLQRWEEDEEYEEPVTESIGFSGAASLSKP